MCRPLIALPFVVAVAVVLAGCTGDEPTPDPTQEPGAVTDVGVCEAPGGDAVASIDVSGDFGSAPTVTFAAPLAASATERVVAIEGDDAEPGALVSIAYALYDGTTGAELETFGWGEGDGLVRIRGDYAMVQEGFAQTIGCAGLGSRVVGVIPAAETDDVIVFVADVLSDHVWSTDLPEIGGTADAPTVTLPATAPETDLRIAVVEEGDGDVVGPTDSVSVHYLGTAWETGEVFDSSYGRGAPSTFAVQGVVEGFSEALIGQKVGSRVLVSMPPALGYGEAGTSQHALAGLTLVFLVDIVAVG